MEKITKEKLEKRIDIFLHTWRGRRFKNKSLIEISKILNKNKIPCNCYYCIGNNKNHYKRKPKTKNISQILNEI